MELECAWLLCRAPFPFARTYHTMLYHASPGLRLATAQGFDLRRASTCPGLRLATACCTTPAPGCDS
eukprot:352888-Chlamydomonas_euryale.AAC.7